MDLRVRKITTASSHNDMWVLFETGKMNTPICLLYEREVEQLQDEIKKELHA